MKLVHIPIERPVATLVLLISLMVLGCAAVMRLPLDFFPSVESPSVWVQIPFPGSHPLEGLRKIIEPLEAEIASIPELEEMNSNAESGHVSIRAEFSHDADLELRKLEVREAVERIKPILPTGIGRISVESYEHVPGGGAMLIGRLSAKRSLRDSWDLLDRHIRRPLERIKGVASVELGGVSPQQVRIDVDLYALRKHGIQPEVLFAELQSANLDLDLGAVRGDLLHYNVRSIGRFRSVEEIARLPLASGIRLQDVAEVSVREPYLHFGRHLDGQFAVSLEIQKEPSANTVATVDRVLAKIDEIKLDPALEGISLLVWNNAGEEIRSSLNGLLRAGAYGGLLAVTVLFAFLRKARTTLVVAVAIPFSLLVTCGGMYALGLAFNVLTLLGLMLGVGMLVDNAVVVIENIYRLQATGLDPMESAKLGARQVSMAVLASTATTIVVWSWLFISEKNDMVIYMQEVAITICLSVACSLLISLTFIPLAASRFHSGKPVGHDTFNRRFIPAYRKLLARTLRHRSLALILLVCVAASAYYPIHNIEKSGEPKFRDVQVRINYNAYDASSREVMEGYVNQVEAWLEPRKDELGYENLYSFFRDHGYALTFVYLPRDEANEESLQELRERLRADLPVIPGVKLDVGDQAWQRGGGGSARRVSVALHGEDPEYMEELARRIEKIAKDVPSVKDVRGPSMRGQFEARIMVDSERARSLSVSPRDIATQVAFAHQGRSLRRFQTSDGELEMLIGLPDDMKSNLASLTDLPIQRAGADPVPLGSVAAVNVVRSDIEVHRENRQTTTHIEVEFPKDLTTEEAKQRMRTVLAEFDLPPGYHWDFGTWWRHREQGLETMLHGVLLSLLVVMLLMAALFESISQPMAILITLPMAFFGSFWLLFALGKDLDSVGFMGLIILIGIVVNNGIVMIDRVNALRRGGQSRTEALIQGCGDRLRPVLMTAITTLVGLIPLALSRYTVANAYIDTLAIVVIGGLATSTIFTLLALPVWYTTVEDIGSIALRALPRKMRSK